MKPNFKQVTVSEVVKGQAKFWQVTNDIDSPTHCCDIDQDCMKLDLEEVLTEEQSKQLAEKLTDIYFFIKNLK